MVLSRLYYGAFGGHRMVTDGYKGGVYYSNVVGTSDTTGKSRIVRSGSTWTGSYYDYDDVTWYTVGSHTISTAPVEIRLANWYATSNAGSTFDFDNFTINTGTIGSEI
jgi:hypothetical protein